MPRQLRTGFDTLKDAALFVAGLSLGGYAVTREPIEPTLLALAVALCIAPATLLPGSRK